MEKINDKKDILSTNDGVKVLSLFDGMSCAMLALLNQNIKVNKYIAYEIDKYAIKTTTHNFPEIEHRGDVFNADFTEFRNFDYLMGGSPCTYWSIAQKNNRETEASGLGWELFSQYVRALKEAQPKYFIYENNKSMSNAIRESITKVFGFEPICINSALLSAQNRQRLYWVGKRNNDGTYSKIEIEQPEDRGILLKDILEDGLVEKDKAYCLKHQAGNARDYFKKHHTQIKFEPVACASESQTVLNAIPLISEKYGYIPKMFNAYNRAEIKDKAPTLSTGSMVTSSCAVNKFEKVAEPVRVGSLPRPNGELSQSQAFRVYDIEGKSVNINSGGGGAGGKTGLYAVPLKVGEVNGGGQGNRIYSVEGKAVSQTATSGGIGSNTGLYAIPLETDIVPFVENKLDKAVEKFGYIPEMWNPYNNAEITDKAPTQTAQCASKTSSCTVFMTSSIYYAEPCEWGEEGKPIKAISFADGKEYIVYEVKNSLITIKGKEYPIKLGDGFYIIRKLTVRECMRLQTVPEWFDFSVVSDTQAYKMLGNGWTVDVIAYLLSHTK